MVNFKTKEEVIEYIKSNPAQSAGLIQKLLEDACPNWCEHCIFEPVCVRECKWADGEYTKTEGA